MSTLEITEDTKVSEILDEYGDIADVMEALGMKRVGGLSVDVAQSHHKGDHSEAGRPDSSGTSR
jgi:hypothetical protein